MRIQDKTVPLVETLAEMGACGDNSEALGCCMVAGGMGKELALDRPRTNKADATAVSTFGQNWSLNDHGVRLTQERPSAKD